METYNMVDAARIAGVSDKTLRRAIVRGVLTIQPRLTEKHPIRISQEDLDAYIASRVPTATNVKASRVQTPVDDTTQEHLTAMQQEIVSLTSRVAELEKTVDDLRSLDLMAMALEEYTGLPFPKIIEAASHIQQTKKQTDRESQLEPKQPKNRTRKQQEATFELADFSKGAQSEYDCKVTEGDICAVMKIGVYTLAPNKPYLYTIRSFDWYTFKKTRKTTEYINNRGPKLMAALHKKVLAEMTNHGWIEVRTDSAGKVIYRKPD